MPDAHGVAVLLLTVAALILFTRDRIPLESSSLVVLIVLITGFYLFPYLSDMSVPVIISAFILVMCLLTNIVTHTAAAVIGTPIAIAIAQRLNTDPEPFILAVMFGSNMSFLTPFGYQTNLLIFGAVGYKFSDFLRVGIPLSLIMWIGYSIVLPLLYDVI